MMMTWLWDQWMSSHLMSSFSHLWIWVIFELIHWTIVSMIQFFFNSIQLPIQFNEFHHWIFKIQNFINDKFDFLFYFILLFYSIFFILSKIDTWNWVFQWESSMFEVDTIEFNTQSSEQKLKPKFMKPELKIQIFNLNSEPKNLTTKLWTQKI